MNDYMMSFPASSLGTGVNGYKALRDELRRDGNPSAQNALGDPRDADGNIVVQPPYTPGDPPPVDNVAFHGRPGSAATTAIGPDGEPIDIPAKGDPALYYVHVRSEVDAPAFDRAAYGMTPSDARDSAAVLGIWLGDEVPT